MTAAQDASGDDAAAETAQAKIADAGRKMARYKAAIGAGGDLEEISTWISDAKTQRLAAEVELRPGHHLNPDDPPPDRRPDQRGQRRGRYSARRRL
jgi:hypothetical protein